VIEPLLAHDGVLHLRDTFDIIGLTASVLFAAVAGYRLAVGASRRRRAEAQGDAGQAP